MEEVTRLRLPWRLLLERLTPPCAPAAGPRTHVAYADTLTELAESAPGVTVSDTLYRNKESLQAVFRLIDKDHSGYITAEEFEEALTVLGEQMPGAAADLCRSLDMNKDGAVDLNEFLEAFRLVQMAGAADGSGGGGDDDEDDDDGRGGGDARDTPGVDE